MENYAMTTYININGDVRDASSLTVPTDRTFRGAWTSLEAGSGAAEIATQKQTLRDITDDARIANAADADALKALDLATLLGE
jgi:predicted secreted protein